MAVKRNLKLFMVPGLLALAFGCANVGGAMIGKGIGDIAGNEVDGMLIGAGIGMMVDVMD